MALASRSPYVILASFFEPHKRVRNDLAASVLPAPGTGFSIPAFLHDAGTLYMIAEAVSEDAPVAPLFAAMATEIHWIAAQIGQASPSGRLDPPLLMGLDEVTQICPVPVPAWAADAS